MLISGLQKLTLLDFPGTVSCIVFTHGCNFRCPFCHNSSLVGGPAREEISENEVVDFLKSRKNILDGVVVSGGEPLLHPDIAEFLKKVKELGYKVKIDTNGTKPEMLKKLVNDGLVDYVAMDIKNSPEQYKSATGVDGLLEAVTESKDFLLSGNVEYEFRTTVVKGIHTKEQLVSLAKWIKGAKKYYLQKYKCSENVLNPEGLDSFSDEEMEGFLAEISSIINMSCIR
ncbi:MAG: anaerobic ribonucleoside-triphosphate reductase activating protein [Clostridia bacterium]|nr:anaerobic ribonucleoside-triphosphate reductase activating protein [Clostridia bacterium]